MTTRVPQPLLVRGTVKLPAGVAFKGAQVRVQLLDCSLADAPSTVLAETLPIAVLDDSEPVEFELRGEVPQGNGYYTVAALVKPGKNSQQAPNWDAFEPGDAFNTQAYPVALSADKTAEVEVETFRYAGPAEKQ